MIEGLFLIILDSGMFQLFPREALVLPQLAAAVAC
jgi:hypothetical protein